jgi:hypothetical protein
LASGDFLDLSEHALRSAQLAASSGTAYSAGDLAQANAKVNEAYLSLTHSGDPWDFLEKEGQWDTVAGSDKYTYASIASAMSVTGGTIREIHVLLDDDNGAVLKPMSWEDLERVTDSVKDDEGTGRPVWWAKWGGANVPTIRLFPSPDAAITIGVFCSLVGTEMTDGADVPLIPLAWRHRVVVPYAAALLLEQEGGPEAGAQYERLMRRYQDAYAQMRTALATAKRPTFNAIQPGFMEREMAGGWGGW